jgi:hypothetical protein
MYRFTDGKQGVLVPDTFAYCPVDGHKEGMEGEVIVNEGSGARAATDKCWPPSFCPCSPTSWK